MVDEIRSDSIVKKHLPYNISDVKSGNFDAVSLFSVNSYKSTFEIKEPEEKRTEAEKLHESWDNVVGGLSQEFFDEIEAMSKRLMCKPEDLAALIYGESRFSPKSADGQGHNGIIQLDNYSLQKSIEYSLKHDKQSSKLDKDMNMSDFVKLSKEEQLPYAEAYLHLMKDECGLKGKKLSGGKLWGLIKSPRLTKSNNQEFIKKLEHQLDSIKDIPLKYEIPFYIKRNPDE